MTKREFVIDYLMNYLKGGGDERRADTVVKNAAAIWNTVDAYAPLSGLTRRVVQS